MPYNPTSSNDRLPRTASSLRLTSELESTGPSHEMLKPLNPLPDKGLRALELTGACLEFVPRQTLAVVPQPKICSHGKTANSIPFALLISHRFFKLLHAIALKRTLFGAGVVRHCACVLLRKSDTRGFRPDDFVPVGSMICAAQPQMASASRHVQKGPPSRKVGGPSRSPEHGVVLSRRA
jgi:hypothetical protein